MTNLNEKAYTAAEVQEMVRKAEEMIHELPEILNRLDDPRFEKSRSELETEWAQKIDKIAQIIELLHTAKGKGWIPPDWRPTVETA